MIHFWITSLRHDNCVLHITHHLAVSWSIKKWNALLSCLRCYFQVYVDWARSILCEEKVEVKSFYDLYNPRTLALLIDTLWPAAKLRDKLEVRQILINTNEFQCLSWEVKIIIFTYDSITSHSL